LLSIVKFNPLLRLPEFMIGIGLGTLYLDGKRIARPRTVAIASLVGLVVLLIFLTRLPYPAFHNAVLAPVFVILILSLASDPTMLCNRTLVLLGEASYSLYLLHAPLSDYCFGVAKRLGCSNPVWVGAAYVPLTVLASVVSYKLIEIPGRALVHSLFRRRRSRSLLLASQPA
jgi:peptidoglycan/LPS O-acetylase OafA/YrhL